MPEGLCRVMVVNKQRNTLVINILWRHTADHERCKLDGYQWVLGIPGGQSPGNLYISLHARSQPVRPLVPSSARGIDGGPRRFTEVAEEKEHPRFPGATKWVASSANPWLALLRT